MTPAAVGLRCPEHAGKARRFERVARPAQQRATSARRAANRLTLGLIALNILVYLAELAAGGSIDGTGNWIYEHGALFASGQFAFGGPLMGVAHGEWWRLVTAAFLHYGPLHLALNMYALYLAGTLLEHVIGGWRFLLLYVASGVAGSAGALLLTPNSPTVGASGAIFGVFGALFVLERRRFIATGGTILGLIVLNLVFTFAVSGISIGGHIGGLVAGIVLMVLFLSFRRSAVQSIASAAAIGAIAVIVAYMKVRNYQ
jgi:membrane associated rhomboid family serine protease